MAAERIAPSAFLSPLLHSIYQPLLRVDGSAGNAVSFLCFNLCSINISNGACTSQLTQYLAVKITLGSGCGHVSVEGCVQSSVGLREHLQFLHIFSLSSSLSHSSFLVPCSTVSAMNSNWTQTTIRMHSIHIQCS